MYHSHNHAYIPWPQLLNNDSHQTAIIHINHRSNNTAHSANNFRSLLSQRFAGIGRNIVSNLSQTFADGSRLTRTELYDGTARVIETAPDGSTISNTLVASDEVLEIESQTPEVIAAQAISDEITVRLDPAGTIPEIKAAIIDGLAAAIAALGG